MKISFNLRVSVAKSIGHRDTETQRKELYRLEVKSIFEIGSR